MKRMNIKLIIACIAISVIPWGGYDIAVCGEVLSPEEMNLVKAGQCVKNCKDYNNICQDANLCGLHASPEECTGNERHGSGITTWACTGPQDRQTCTTSNPQECYHFHKCEWRAGLCRIIVDQFSPTDAPSQCTDT